MPASANTMENGNPTQGEGKDPSSFLSDIIGNPVTVKLNSGVVYKGTVSIPSHQDMHTLSQPGRNFSRDDTTSNDILLS